VPGPQFRSYDLITTGLRTWHPCGTQVKPAAVDVRELSNRWESCSAKGAVAFHWKCIMAPQTIIDYIVVHELCHFHQRDHNDAFWNEVYKVMPAYRASGRSG
jgi:predicted metal-dependent hydrolase